MHIDLRNATKTDVIKWMERVTRLAHEDWATGHRKRTGKEILSCTARGWRNGHEHRAAVIYSTAQWTFKNSEDA